jgi:WD40 repeat protein
VRYWPKGGRVRTVHLESTATVLLGLGGPQGHIWRVAVGDCNGTVHLLSLPELHRIDGWTGHTAAVTAITADVSDDGDMRLITGDSSGQIRLLHCDSDGEGRLLNEIGERITSIRAERHRLILMSGWQRRILSRVGERLIQPSPAKPPRKVQTRLPVTIRSTTPVRA